MLHDLYKPVKELGQNFLTDYSIAKLMIDQLDLKEGDSVVEVGPGLGTLTDILSQRIVKDNGKIYAVEIDKRFIKKLRTMFVDRTNVDIVEANILDWLLEFKPKGEYKILGSLPYYITSPIIHLIIKTEQRAATCVLLVQKEVARKICANVPDASYLSTCTQTFYDAEYVKMVDKSKFSPEPDVDGGIIKLVQKNNVSISSEEIRKYEGFLHKGFSNPRKMLNKVFSKNELSRVNIESSLRPQNISTEQWIKLFKNTAHD